MPSFSRSPSRRAVIAAALGAVIFSPAASAGETVNVYSYRQPALVQPLFDGFTAATGIAVRVLFAENGLVERIAQEGQNSPADVLLTADAGRLVEAASRGVGAPVTSPAILSKIPANLRDPAGQWFGLTMRARVLYASRERVPETALSYEDLALPKWQGRICIRPGNHPYNLGLIAAMIAHLGEDGARTWLQGLKANLAVKPSGNDRSQAKSVYAGECDLAIANTYYLGLMLTDTKEPEQQEWAKSLRIIFPRSAAISTELSRITPMPEPPVRTSPRATPRCLAQRPPLRFPTGAAVRPKARPVLRRCVLPSSHASAAPAPRAHRAKGWRPLLRSRRACSCCGK